MFHDFTPYEVRRRQMLWVLLGGALGQAMPIHTFAQSNQPRPQCVLSPRQTEGPYFIDTRLERSDIRDSAEGSPLQLQLRVVDVENACTPLAGVAVEIWHCDARGVYSGVGDAHAGVVSGSFLRGYQRTNDDGVVNFTTIYPGWYPGRCVHIHVKVRSAKQEWTSQLYFDDHITDAVHGLPAYRRGMRTRTRNAQDGIFRRGGAELMLPLEQNIRGYRTQFEIGTTGFKGQPASS